jgi:hypothetical protein
MPSKSHRFRPLVEAEEIPIQPGIYDGCSARLLINELMGFGASKDMEQSFLTTAQKQAKYGAAAE